MDDIELLERVLDKTGTIVTGVTPDQYDQPTPCPDYDVKALVNHITGWVRSFAAGANGGTYEGDPNAYVAGDVRAASSGLQRTSSSRAGAPTASTARSV